MGKKPRIRFAGFTDDWEQRKLGEYVEITSGDSPAKFCEGNINYVKVDDLNYAYKTVLQTQNRVLQNNSVKMVRAGSVIFPKRGAAILTNKVRILGVDSYMDTNMMALSSEKLDTDFLYILLSKEGLYKIADTSTIPQINNKHIEPYEICLPNLDEQKMIGRYFSELDNLITLHQCKVEETKLLKEYMLQKMFPKDGENVPEIRFAGYTDEWEQCKVGELTKELTEYATMESGLPLLTSARSGIMYQSEYRGNTTTENNNTLFSVVPMSACTYRHMSDDDTFHLNINNLEKGLVSREYPVFVASGDNDLNFLVHYINSSNRFLAFCKQQKKGGTRTRLYYKVLCDFELMAPKSEEQRVISAYFSQLDQLITLHQRKCEEMKCFKKYMLQNMLV